MELSFVFTSQSNLTLFDDRISAITDPGKAVKLIAKKDMLLKGHDEQSLVSASVVNDHEDIEAAYTLVDSWLDLDKTIVEIEATVYAVNKMGLLILSHGGRILLSGKNSIQVLMVSEAGEEEASIAHEHEFCGKWTVIRIFLATANRLVIMFDDKELFLDFPDNMTKGVKIQGFLGRLSGTKASIHSIRTYDRSALDDLLSARMAKTIASETVIGELKASEEEKAEIAIVQQTNKLKGVWTAELMQDLESYRGTKGEDKMMDAANNALKGYKGTNKTEQTQETMGETIFDLLNRITGMSTDELSKLSHISLLQRVYNALNNDAAYAQMDHAALLKETHFLCSKFLAGEGVMIVQKIGLGGKSYRTFEFGEVNDMNCTPQMLLHLVKAYPDVWLKRLV